MEINENFVTEEEVTENTEQTVEETPAQETAKTYTQEEVDAIIGRKKARWEARQRRETERAQNEERELINTLRAGTGKENASARELNEAFTQFYTEKGRIKKNPTPSSPSLPMSAGQ